MQGWPVLNKCKVFCSAAFRPIIVYCVSMQNGSKLSYACEYLEVVRFTAHFTTAMQQIVQASEYTGSAYTGSAYFLAEISAR